MPDVQHKRGTRADLNTLAAANGLLVGQIYFITDESRIAVATAVGAYQAAIKESGDSPTFANVTASGIIVADMYRETVGDNSSGTLDLSTGNVFSDTPSANATYVFSNPPASGTAYVFTLKITPSGTYTVTWPTSVDWAAATAPDAPASGATNVYSFYTQDGGATWYGFLAGAAMG